MNDIGTYLAMLAGPKPDGWLELRWKLPGGMGREFFRPGDPQLETLIHAGANKTDLYVGVALRARRDGGKSGIDRLHLLWVDLDTREAVERAVDFEPPPTMVVWSGSGGAHAYWQLDEAVSPAEAEIANRRLAVRLGADACATDAARILRPPETLNWKHDPPKPVVLDRWRGGTYSIEHVVGQLLDPNDELSCRREPSVRTEGSDDDPLLRIPPDIYIEALTGQEVGRDGKIACPFHPDRTPSLHVYEQPERGWTCFGCGKGGTIIDFGAALYGIEPRGAGYHEIRDRLEADLRRRAAA